MSKELDVKEKNTHVVCPFIGHSSQNLEEMEKYWNALSDQEKNHVSDVVKNFLEKTNKKSAFYNKFY